jgi:hypothetical protein
LVRGDVQIDRGIESDGDDQVPILLRATLRT